MYLSVPRDLLFFDRADRGLGSPSLGRCDPVAADWFGDTLLTYAGELVDFFSGAVVGALAVEDRG